MSVIYNEIAPYPAQWLENLVAAKHIAPGYVDKRDIKEVQPEDVQDATQFHAFAGIGAWSHALHLAGWPDEMPVWTGSCPCQPFSIAGKRKGSKDARHLWPEWLRLIDKCRPPVIFGEQVASPDGRAWLDNVSTDLEALDYAVGSADLCAASVGAPHIRQRLFFVAYSTNREWRDRFSEKGNEQEIQTRRHSVFNKLAYSNNPRLQGRIVGRNRANQGIARQNSMVNQFAGSTCGFWSNAEWIQCRDGKNRPIEPGTLPLAYGITNRVGRLRAYGNAIVPQIAATFIQASMGIYQ